MAVKPSRRLTARFLAAVFFGFRETDFYSCREGTFRCNPGGLRDISLIAALLIAALSAAIFSVFPIAAGNNIYQQPRPKAPSRSEFLGIKPLNTNKFAACFTAGIIDSSNTDLRRGLP